MRDRLQNAFHYVQAEEELKAKTLAAIARKAPLRRFRPLLLAAACFALLLGLSAGLVLFFTPVSTVSVDINPSLELSVNRFDRVIGVTPYNAEGEALNESTSLLFSDYSQAVRRLLAAPEMQAYLEKGESLSVFVACDDPQRTSRMLSDLEECTRGSGAHCHAGSMEHSSEAHSAGLSCGKYAAYLEWRALDPSVTPEQVQEMTMREIRERIRELAGGNASASSSSESGGKGHGNGKDHGSGTGHGKGKGHRNGHHAG